MVLKIVGLATRKLPMGPCAETAGSVQAGGGPSFTTPKYDGDNDFGEARGFGVYTCVYIICTCVYIYI